MYAAANRHLRGEKRAPHGKKQRNLPAVSPAMVAIAAAVLVTFIGGLYFITHHKKEESETLQSQKVTGNGLPPKPEERWRYIKELESRQPGVRAPTEPSAGGEVKTPEQLTPEQRQLLEQMQADMRQQPTQLVEVPWNEQTPEQRQQTLQRQRQAQQLAEQQRLAQQSRTTEQSWQQQTRTSQAAPVQAQPRQSKPASTQQPYQGSAANPLRTPPRSRSRSKLRQLLVPLTRQNRRRRKKTNAAGWCSAVRSEARNRLRRYVLSWRSKDLTRKSPPTMAGIVWSLAR